MRLKSLLLSSGAFLAPFLYSSSALTVEVKSESSECYSLELEKGTRFSGNYEVLTEDFEWDSVDVKVTGPTPHRTVHYTSTGKEEGSFSLEAADSGDHVLCLTNTDGAEDVVLGFALRSDELSPDAAPGVATEENVKSMIQVANELTQGLDMLADHQEFMRVREDTHRQTVARTSDKLMWWSGTEAVVLSAMSIWQILYIRTFFETKRSI